MKRLLLHLVALLLLVGIAACAPVAQAPDPTATPDYQLTQTHTHTDLLGGTVTLRYPTQWVTLLRDDVLLLANDSSITLDPSQDMPAGSVALSISVIPNILAGFSVGEGQAPTPYNILMNYVTKFAQSEENPIAFAQPQLLLMDGQPAASISGSNASDETLIIARTLANDSGYALLVTVADKGELASWQGMITAIADTLRYQP